jgi:hypothetical protein
MDILHSLKMDIGSRDSGKAIETQHICIIYNV